MKTINTLVISTVSCASCISAFGTPAQIPMGESSPLQYAIVQRGASHNTWEATERFTNSAGHVTLNHNVIELSTGINYFDETTREWKPTVQEWEAFNQALVAQHGPHKTILATNVNFGNCVDLLGDGGTRLRANPVAIGVFDPVSQRHAIVANVIDCAPQWGADHSQVVFPHCFDNLDASIIYNYKTHGFSQWILLEQNFELPDGFSQQSLIECYTEFDSTTPIPVKQTHMIRPDFPDETLDWGDLKIGRGKAFVLRGESNKAGIPVAKSYQVMDGRPV